jgi:hypothetical protein
LQLALNQPSQHHPFSRAFCSFYEMNPTEQRPQNNHDGRPKRRHLDGPSPGDTPAINQYVSTFNRSPVAASIPNQSAKNRPSDPSHAVDDDSFIDRLSGACLRRDMSSGPSKRQTQRHKT